MPETTNLGNRQKMYERMAAPRLMPGLPICVRGFEDLRALLDLALEKR